MAPSARTREAQELFAPLGPTYDRTGALLSFGRDPAWRRFLVSRVQAGPEDTVLDVATGTGAVALELVRAKGCTVVGLDQSPGMLEEARRRAVLAAATGQVRFVEGHAEELPFEDGSFDALTFTYLFRYVEDPAATLRELARVVRPGGTIAGLEFGVPSGLARPAWELYVRIGLPVAGRVVSPAWGRVGSFLGGGIRDHWRGRPVGPPLQMWGGAGGGAPGPGGGVGGGTARGGGGGGGGGGRGGGGGCRRGGGRPGGERRGEPRTPPRVLRAPPGWLARLRARPPPAVHALAPELR